MLLLSRILVSTIALGASAVSVVGCGQQGPLYLPTDAAAANRATLPETIFRSNSTKAAAKPKADASLNTSPTPSTAPAVTPTAPQ